MERVFLFTLRISIQNIKKIKIPASTINIRKRRVEEDSILLIKSVEGFK